MTRSELFSVLLFIKIILLESHETKTSVTPILVENRLVPTACMYCYDLENN